PGKKRVIYLTPKPRFSDIDAGVEVPQGATLVPSELIVSGDGDDVELLRKTLANIAFWRETQGLAVETVSTQTKAEEHGSRSLLDLLLSQLNDSEKKRVQMPLDIVAKLRDSIVK
ncbi:hypothetical protein JKG41_15315, partial [Acidithiobacillus sp. MC2.1]|uniref:hypothetical protein n=1 Tax=Acidithiobacillus sp. MC2.2 TaxID=2801579 RepID=UPI0019D119B5